MESKYMKTSHSIVWECKPFIHVFMIFRLTYHMEMILYIDKPYFKAQHKHQHKHYSNKCALNMRVWGNGEEGMRE